MQIAMFNCLLLSNHKPNYPMKASSFRDESSRAVDDEGSRAIDPCSKVRFAFYGATPARWKTPTLPPQGQSSPAGRCYRPAVNEMAVEGGGPESPLQVDAEELLADWRRQCHRPCRAIPGRRAVGMTRRNLSARFVPLTGRYWT